MTELIFERLSVKNFMSFGQQPTTINLNSHKSTILVAENGSGKTAFLIDSIFYVLFGEAFRNIKKAAIPNSINQKETLCELELRVDGNPWKISRGMKPEDFIVTKNGEEVWSDVKASDKQSNLVSELGINKTILPNIVLISEESTPFMRLSGPDRRACVERILNLSVFSEAHVEVKKKMKELKDPFLTLKTKFETKQELITRLNKIIANSDSPDEEKIEAAKRSINKIDDFLSKANPQIEKLDAKISELEKKWSSINSEIFEAKMALKDAESKLAKFSSGVCPTCGGEIHSDEITSYTDAVEAAKSLFDEKQKEADSIKEEIRPISEKRESGFQKTQSVLREKSNHQRTIDIESAKTSSSSTVDEELSEAETELADLLDEYTEKKEEIEDYTELDKVLKSGDAKLPVINDYIPFFNQKINEHLENFGLKIKFELDGEFNETIRARYKDQFTYESFSRGQRERIDFAILMTWRDVASKLSSLETNLLVVDEFASKLDNNGFEVISSALSKLENSNVFCIVPVEKPNAEFDRKLKLTIKSEFSILEEL